MLQWNNVTSGYHRKPIIKNIQLTVGRGEFLAIIGLNGSGKSTLLKTALGLLRPFSGQVVVDEKPLDAHPLKVRAKKISLLEARFEATFAMTVGELLEISARVLSDGERQTITARALGAVGLNGRENENLQELSSGEIRRAMLAHTLCANANVILLDEPFAHLDWHHQNELAESLRHWGNAFNTTFVLAVHELEWAAKIADRICVMHEGQVLICAEPAEVFQNEKVREVFAFRAAIDENPIDGSKRLTLGQRPANK